MPRRHRDAAFVDPFSAANGDTLVSSTIDHFANVCEHTKTRFVVQRLLFESELKSKIIDRQSKIQMRLAEAQIAQLLTMMILQGPSSAHQ